MTSKQLSHYRYNINMNGVDILNKIIAEEGSCCWATPTICNQCPMSRLKKHPNGSWMSCVEAVGVQDISSEEEADAKYKAAAEKLLLENAVEDMLKSQVQE